MKKAIGVAITDEISKYNTKCTIRGLLGGYSEAWCNGLPMFYNHDRTKCFGWISLLSMYFEPNLAKLTNVSLFPENDAEMQQLKNRMTAFQVKQYKKEEQNFNVLIEKIKDYISSDYKKHINGCVCIYDKDIIKRVFPNLIEDLDDDNLIEVSKLKEIMPGVYEKDGFILFAHAYFRRGLSRLNVLNEPFFEVFSSVSKLPDVCAKVAIDFDVIGLLGTQHRSMEFQYWWGPKFDDTFSDIEYGVTLHKNEKYNEFLDPMLQTEFWWYKQDGKNTFECEEIISASNTDLETEMYGCRFVHSMIDSESDIPVHLDGAIRAYTEEKMLERLDQKISETDRKTDYTKLWRLDGKIPPAAWKELITHYYRDNILIGEYFNGKDEQEIKNTNKMIGEIIEPIKKCVPYSMNEGEGLRFSIRFKEKEELSNEYDVLVRTNQILIKSGSFSKYIDSQSTTLFKLVRQKNINIREPLDAVKRIEFNDTVTNFPTFLCLGANSVQNANTILDCINILCNAWIQKGDNRILTFTLEIEYANHNVLYSFAGHIKDVAIWLKSKGSHFPASTEKVIDWCNTFAEFLYKYPTPNNQPETFELLNEDGTLYFRRIFIENDMVKKTEVDDTGLFATIAIHKDDIALVEALQKNNMSITAAMHVKHSVCSKCAKDYRQCNCIKFIDDVYEKLDDFEGVGFYWTNRKAQ